MGQGQPRVIICITLVVLPYTTTHTRRRRFIKVFTIYGHGGHVGHVTQLICINFHSQSPLSFFWMDARCPVPRLWICSAEVRGNVVRRMGTQQQQPLSFHMSFGSKSPNCFCEKQVLTLKSEWPLTKVKE